MTHLIIDKGVFRTAPATPGLLNTTYQKPLNLFKVFLSNICKGVLNYQFKYPGGNNKIVFFFIEWRFNSNNRKLRHFFFTISVPSEPPRQSKIL